MNICENMIINYLTALAEIKYKKTHIPDRARRRKVAKASTRIAITLDQRLGIGLGRNTVFVHRDDY